jgi:adenosylcobinamide-phosphate guanylyltransferase
MHALIMAGGAGSRLNLGEKPLVTILGRPMIAYVIDAFIAAECDPLVAVSFRTPMTINWCRAHSVEFCISAGSGYIEDMTDAVGVLGEDRPLFICASVIPCITADIIRTIADRYGSCGKDACSTWIPSVLVKACRGSVHYHEIIAGVDACPAGVNILRGDIISEPQDELQLLLHEPRLALNVNTRSDLENAESFFKTRKFPDNSC